MAEKADYKFEAGDLVMLKSGGPVMTIQNANIMNEITCGQANLIHANGSLARDWKKLSFIKLL